jgi:hypothetical protein
VCIFIEQQIVFSQTLVSGNVKPADWHIQAVQENIFHQPKPNIMILNADEEVVMASDNKQIVLTTKRIIQESKNATKSIDLKDYKAYEIVRKRNNYYLYFLPFPVIISLFAVAIVMAVLVVLLLLFWAVIQEKFIVLIGAHSRIEFLAKGISEASLNKFIQSIESLSKEAKEG